VRVKEKVKTGWEDLGIEMNNRISIEAPKHLKLRVKSEKKGKEVKFCELHSSLLKCLVGEMVEAF
jgi:hypothetical protein